jgi:hypothetical protein
VKFILIAGLQFIVAKHSGFLDVATRRASAAFSRACLFLSNNVEKEEYVSSQRNECHQYNQICYNVEYHAAAEFQVRK